MIPRSDANIARTLAKLHAESWRSAYRGLYSDAFLDHEVHADRLTFWASRVPELRALDAELFLATRQGRPVGFTCIETGPQCTHGAYIDNLHVLPASQGCGVGRLLVERAAGWARTRGESTLYLFVFAGNAKARAFYAATGWHEAGREMHTMVTGDTAPVLRLVKHL